MVPKGFVVVAFVVLFFGTCLVSGADELPQCVLDAFPELNKTIDSRDVVAQLDDIYGKSDESLGCRICLGLMTEVDNILTDPTIEDAIAHAVENLCLPIIWVFEICWRLVESCMDDAIEQFVEMGLAPRDFCEALFFCPANATVA